MDIQTADRLVQFRREAGFSQEELATRLGVSRQAVSKWERAESSPDTDNLLALARLYSVSLDELVGHTPAPRQSLEPCREEPEPEPAPFPAPSAGMEEAAPFLVEEERVEKLIKWVKFPYPVLVTFFYLLTGFLFHLWHPLWVLFLTIPIYYIVAVSLDKEEPFSKTFGKLLPVLVTFLFFLLGAFFGLWHPAWMLFLVIPLYYGIAACVKA